MLTEKDLKQLEAHGLTLDDVIAQLEKFQQGTPFVNVVTPASIGNGIEAVTETQKQEYISFYDARKKDKEIVKFVPASGAATRMFKFLIQFLEEFDPEEERLATFIKNGGHHELKKFIDNIKHLPFVNEVRRTIREQHPEFKNNKKGVRAKIFVETLLSQSGLNYKNLPKGLIPFHKYKKYSTTAFEEQLYEAAFYATAVNNTYLHFTFSQAHVNLFKEEFNRIKKRV